jgi:hypothetical protein
MSERATPFEYARALLRLPPFRPLPALILVLVLWPFLPEAALQPQMTTRRTLALAELALVLSCAGTVLYWVTLYLSQLGILHIGRGTRGMRDPSEAELAIADLATRGLCLLMVYAGPALLLWLIL